MKRLIINADDFGLHDTVNEGIITAFREGSLTSATLMAGAGAAVAAASLALENPGLGVGVHLTLVAERPVSDPADIPSLVDAEGMLAPQYPQFLRKYCSGRIRLSEIRRELAAQVDKVVALGVRPTHFDSHQHIHVMPGIRDIVIDLAREYDVPAVRCPAEDYLFFGGFSWTTGRFIGRGGLSFLARGARRKFRAAGLASPDHFFGMLAGGSMTEKYLLRIMAALPDGTSEIMMHPGADNTVLGALYPWGYHWEQELSAVVGAPVKAAAAAGGIKLISFRGLTHE